MSIKDLSPPGQEPIDLPYAKTFLRVDGSDEDGLISDLIVSARLRVEALIRVSLVTRRRLYTTDKLSDSGLYINHGPVSQVHSVKAVDKDGTMHGLTPFHYTVDLRAVPARLCLNQPYRWSNFGSGTAYAEIELDSGYGSGAGDVPMPLKQAVLLLVAQGYEYRAYGTAPPVPMMVDALLMPYRSLKL